MFTRARNAVSRLYSAVGARAVRPQPSGCAVRPTMKGIQRNSHQPLARSFSSLTGSDGARKSMLLNKAPLLSNPPRYYQWNSFFAQFENEEKIPQELEEKIRDVLNDTELEIQAFFEPKWGRNAYDPSLFGLVKGRIEEIESFIRSTPEVKPIDFDYYRSRVADPSTVDQLEAEHKRTSVVDVQLDFRRDFSGHADLLEQKAVEFRDQFTGMIAEIENHLNYLKESKRNLRGLTHEQILAEHPEWRDEILAEVEKDGFVFPYMTRFKGDEQLEAQSAATSRAVLEDKGHGHDHH